MADLNVLYNGFIEKLGTVWEIEVCKFARSPIGGGCIGGSYMKDVSDDELHKDAKAYALNVNAGSVSTVAAVKVAYTPGTDRLTWIQDRIAAINERVAFIQERVKPLREVLVNNGQADPVESLGLALSSINAIAVPFLAPITAILKSAITQDNAQELDSAKQIVAKYTADLQELTTIKQQLVSEYVKTPSPTPTPQPDPETAPKDPTGNAPTPIPTWYYYAGFAAVILFLVYLKNRRN